MRGSVQARQALVVAAYSLEPQRDSISWPGSARALILRLHSRLE